MVRIILYKQPWRVIISALFLTLCFHSSLAQHRQLSIISSIHRYEVDFFLSQKSQEAGRTINGSGQFKFSLGFAYDMGFRKNSLWYFSFRGEYAHRSYSTQVESSGGSVRNVIDFRGHYLDVMLGTSRFFKNQSVNKWGTSIYIGYGVPLMDGMLQDGASQSFVTNSLPFVELDLNFRQIIDKKAKKDLSVSLAPFMRMYWAPAHSLSPTHRAVPPYYAFGIKVKAGAMRY